MSEYCVYLKMPSYLRQWFVHQHGGGEPVKLNRCSPESDLLRMSTIRMPENILPPRQQDDEVAICIPYYKSHDPRTYNYLSKQGKEALLEMIRGNFRVDLWRYLHTFDKYGQELKQLTLLFMELRGIREDGSCYDSISKIYQRQRDSYKKTLRRKNTKN